ncbi:hypothetical protein BDY21DRAFT_7645 [Lineolata rhizophorae]|uniref:Uncharacterized protein n=1 Tax=Lineolata rhizophorae TaxID=578093 RepID=A0A6A6PE72_9PEZI|nr:hypothetical protein BDY21DRAFT_7645 [Lineolata rhizophorae]
MGERHALSRCNLQACIAADKSAAPPPVAYARDGKLSGGSPGAGERRGRRVFQGPLWMIGGGGGDLDRSRCGDWGPTLCAENSNAKTTARNGSVQRES